MPSFELPQPVNPDKEKVTNAKEWEWKEFPFERGTLILTQDAKNLGQEEVGKIFQDIRAFKKNKPPIFHTGSDGSVYVLESGNFMLKEQKSDGRELMQEHEKIKKFMDVSKDFPKDIHLIKYFAIAEPPYSIDKFGRRQSPVSFEEHKTEVAVGGGDWTRQANIGSYVVMPFLGNGINLANLSGYSPQDENPRMQEFVQEMIQNNVITSTEGVREFSEKHFKRIEVAFQNAQEAGSDFRVRDFAKRNIVLTLEGGVPQFYLIDV